MSKEERDVSDSLDWFFVAIAVTWFTVWVLLIYLIVVFVRGVAT
jgi:hypothetical protein